MIKTPDTSMQPSLIRVAKRDLTEITTLHDKLSTESFGFFAQQAVEKSLKSWLNHLEVKYPFTHDLGKLFTILEQNGQKISEYRELSFLTAFAVDLRYDSFEPEVKLHPVFTKLNIVEKVTALYNFIEQKLAEKVA